MFVGNTSGDQIQVQETSEDGSQTNYYLKGDGSFVSVNGYVNIKNNKCQEQQVLLGIADLDGSRFFYT